MQNKSTSLHPSAVLLNVIKGRLLLAGWLGQLQARSLTQWTGWSVPVPSKSRAAKKSIRFKSLENIAVARNETGKDSCGSEFLVGQRWECKEVETVIFGGAL